MTRQAIIERTVKAINQLPEDKAAEISDFADFVTKRYEEHLFRLCWCSSPTDLFVMKTKPKIKVFTKLIVGEEHQQRRKTPSPFPLPITHFGCSKYF